MSHELHREVGLALALARVDHADVEDQHHVAMLETGRGASLAHHALTGVGVGPARDELQGHAPCEANVLGLVHLAHAALAEERSDDVVADPVTGLSHWPADYSRSG